MTKIVSDYGNPIHGVSKQADSKKFEGQCREQLNCRNNLTKGMESRAGFQNLGQLIPENNASLATAKWVINERGDGTNFLVAYDVTRPAFFMIPPEFQRRINARPFTFGAGAEAYYKGNFTVPLTDPKRQLGVSSILDTIFLTNREVTPVGNDSVDNTNTPNKYQWLEFKTFQPGATIKITVSGRDQYYFEVFDGFVSVSSGGDPDREQAERTREYNGSYHAQYFATGNKEGGAGDSDSTSPTIGTRWNNWVGIPGNLTITIIQGSEAVELHNNNSFKEASELPPVAVEGTVARITEGQGEDLNEGYYRAYRKNSSDSSTSIVPVYWKETTAPGSNGSFNKSSMPFTIKRSATDTFTMSQYGWRNREVGSSESNPYPSFVLNRTPIQDIGLFQNRLYLISQETVFMSAVDVYSDLWLESAFYNTQADPFEVFADTQKLNIMSYSNQFDGDLIMFSPNGQFMMAGDVTHTYESAAIMTVAQYESDLLSDPVISGDQIFFATQYGSNAGLRDFYTDNYASTKRSRPLTDHVNDYIPGRIRHLSTSTNIDCLVALNSTEKSSMWLYEWKYTGQEKVQSAWCKWALPQPEGLILEIEHVEFVEATLYAVIKQYDGSSVTYWLWSVVWDDEELEGLPWPVRLDGKYYVVPDTTSFDSELNRTYLPNIVNYSPDMIAVELDGEDAGFASKVEVDQQGRYYVDQKDLRVTRTCLGYPYRQLWSPALPQIKDSEGNSMNNPRMKYLWFELDFGRVGNVSFVVRDDYGREWINTYNNRRVNRPNNAPSVVPYEESIWQVPIRRGSVGLHLHLESYSHIPFALNSVKWSAEYKQRGRRV